MFKVDFNHESSNLVEACGFDNEYFHALYDGVKEIYSRSMKSSFFVESVENQIISDNEIPLNVRRGIQMLLIIISTMKSHVLEDPHVAKGFILKRPELKEVVLKKKKKKPDKKEE